MGDDDDLTTFKIGQREIWEEVRRVGIEVQALAIRSTLRGESDDARHKDTEERLRSLERGRWPLPSLAALFALASFLLALWPLVEK